MPNMKTFLQDMIDDFRFEDLPPNWNSFDLESFSRNKKLWDYQQSTLKNAIKVLWKYFEDFVDYNENEKLETNQERKQKFFNWYRNNGLDVTLDINLNRIKSSISRLLTEYYPVENGKIHYENFINRMSFWMATGSGKTLVIVKLIQILTELIRRKEIPPYDILILTHRDDLIEQLKRHVDEFNYDSETKIDLKELKEYPNVKWQNSVFWIPVFYYRSDNLSDEQKEKIIDFKNYDDNGKWYIFLDEAHKGDKEESKRQHIYSIMSRNGFLFNFSATFIDPRDIITCAFEFNLSSFITSGYGKHISILKQEIRAFRDDEDYNDEEKQKIVLKSLILLTYVRKFYEKIKAIRPDLYHKPMLLTLVNSVNTEDADLKMFFREIEKIGNGKIEDEIFNKALDELWEELKQEPVFMFEEEKLKIDEKIFKKITKQDVLKHVYNSDSPGEIEVLVRPSNRKEMAFKLKTSDRPFALIKIGDISGWLKDELAGYEVQERFEDESYFENLNREDSEINILMGSRGFYEGWDSNRPNVINFINIGTGEEARKFILQSVGRGVRIEPMKNKRKRLLQLYNSKEIDEDLFNKIKDKTLPVETLFIFGTNRNALITVIQELRKERKREEEHQISLFINEKVKKDKLLLVPTYKLADQPLLITKRTIKFEISKEDLELLKKFRDFIQDDRVLLMRYTTEPKKIKLLKELTEDDGNFKLANKSFKNIDLIFQRFLNFLSVVPEEFEKLKELEDEIKHFKSIKVYLKDISELKRKIESVKEYPNRLRELNEEYGKIPPEEYNQKLLAIKSEDEYTIDHQRIKIKHIANHYYLPLIISEDEKIDYIKHIINTKSEVKFVNELADYLNRPNNKFKDFDWWMFSKIDESLDDIYIPYYDPNVNKISKFYPDFIFWLKKDDNYFIVFVDPKGTEHTSAYRKIDGYKEIFEMNGEENVFSYNGLKVKIKLLLKPEDISKALPEYQKYWFDNIEEMLKAII
jgi:hypothetical protein